MAVVNTEPEKLSPVYLSGQIAALEAAIARIIEKDHPEKRDLAVRTLAHMAENPPDFVSSADLFRRGYSAALRSVAEKIEGD